MLVLDLLIFLVTVNFCAFCSIKPGDWKYGTRRVVPFHIFGLNRLVRVLARKYWVRRIGWAGWEGLRSLRLNMSHCTIDLLPLIALLYQHLK